MYTIVYMIAYHVHIYTCASLMHSHNPNPDLSNRISPKLSGLECRIAVGDYSRVSIKFDHLIKEMVRVGSVQGAVKT